MSTQQNRSGGRADSFAEAQRKAKRIRAMYSKGDRVELQHTSDQYTDLKPGAQGTVQMVDGMGTVHVEWDTGQTLGVVPGEDSFSKIDE